MEIEESELRKLLKASIPYKPSVDLDARVMARIQQEVVRHDEERALLVKGLVLTGFATIALILSLAVVIYNIGSNISLVISKSLHSLFDRSIGDMHIHLDPILGGTILLFSIAVFVLMFMSSRRNIT